MSTNVSSGSTPDSYQQNKPFVSAAVRNLISDDFFVEEGIRYSFYKTILPSKYWQLETSQF